MKEALKAKQEKTLNTLVRYEEGVMSRKEWLEIQKTKGNTVEEYQKNRIAFDRRKFNRMNNYADQEEYERKCNEKVVAYKLRLKDDRSYFDITKTEFDYFNSL